MRPSRPSFVVALAGIALAGIALAAAVGHARQARPEAPSSPSSSPSPPVPLLWKVSDADNALYLLGSFHMLRPGDYPLSADVDRAFDEAEALVLELSPEEMTSPQLGMAMAQAGLRTDGRTLREDLSAPAAAKLDAWVAANAEPLGRMGIAPQVLQRLEPWYAGLLISLVEMQKLGLDPEIGLDMHMSRRAAEAGKPASGLERGSEQIAVFDGMGRTEQLQFLEEGLQGAEATREQIETLHAAWRRGDADALWRNMALDVRRQYPELYQRINIARNDAWVPKLRRLLDERGAEDSLVVVGSLHLLGEDGVIEKLRAHGYRVERICSACAAR